MIHRHHVVAIAAVAACLAVATPAAAVDVPHVFEDGTVVSAAEMNANFAALVTELSAALERIEALEAAVDRRLGVIRAVGTDQGVNTSASPYTVDTMLTVETAHPAALVVDYSFSCTAFSGSQYTRWRIFPRVNGEDAPRFFSTGLDRANYTQPSGGSGGPSVVVPVEAGEHSIGYTAERQFGDSSLDCGIHVAVVVLPRQPAADPAAAQTFTAPDRRDGEER